MQSLRTLKKGNKFFIKLFLNQACSYEEGERDGGGWWTNFPFLAKISSICWDFSWKSLKSPPPSLRKFLATPLSYTKNCFYYEDIKNQIILMLPYITNHSLVYCNDFFVPSYSIIEQQLGSIAILRLDQINFA